MLHEGVELEKGFLIIGEENQEEDAGLQLSGSSTRGTTRTIKKTSKVYTWSARELEDVSTNTCERIRPKQTNKIT